jgi:hypothetical protein
MVMFVPPDPMIQVWLDGSSLEEAYADNGNME